MHQGLGGGDGRRRRCGWHVRGWRGGAGREEQEQA
jgi:hypothetical protein